MKIPSVTLNFAHKSLADCSICSDFSDLFMRSCYSHLVFSAMPYFLPIRLLVHHMRSYLPTLFLFLITTILFNNYKIFDLIFVQWKMISKMIAIGLRYYGNFLFWYFHFFLTCSPLYKRLPNTFILKLGTLILFVLQGGSNCCTGL